MWPRTRALTISPCGRTPTPKSVEIARLQLAAGACGLTVAKVGEAEALLPAFDGGLADILVAYPTVDPARTQRLAMLGRAATVRVALDTIDAIDAVAAAAQAAGVTIGVLVDLDVGKGRTGVPTAERLANLAQAVTAARGLRLDGIFCYPSHIWAKPAEQAAPLATVASKLQEAIDLFDRHGLCREVVSGGSTPTAFQSHLVPHEGPDHLVGKLPVVVHQRPAVVVARPDRPAICTSSPACSIVRYH